MLCNLGSHMSKSVATVANKLLKTEGDELEILRMHDFPDDESPHDDALIERLYSEFSAQLDRVQTQLTKKYGPPTRIGETDDDIIPLNGVFRFAVWEIGIKALFIAASHEDRGVPILLVLGTPEADFD